MPKNRKLSDDAQQLLSLLPASGTITNQTAIAKTGWGRTRLMQAKYELSELGLVEILPSLSSTFGKIGKEGTVGDREQSHGLEKDLYKPFEEWIRNTFEPEQPMLFNEGIFEVALSANKRHRPRKWEVPDLLAISCRRYSYVPNIQMDLMSFEVKRQADAFHPFGIFETISHAKLVHYAFYCFEWGVQKDFLEDPGFQRIREEAQLHGIGLVQMYWVNREAGRINAEIILEPRRREPQASVLNDMIAIYFPATVKSAIRRYLANGHL